MEAMQQSSLLSLPPEIFRKIFDLLGIRERSRLQCASRTANIVISSHWKDLLDLRILKGLHFHEKWTEQISNSFWSQCVFSLTTLEFISVDDNLFDLESTENILGAIRSSPPANLISLDLSGFTHGGTTLVTLSKILGECRQIESLKFGNGLGSKFHDERRKSLEGMREITAEMSAVIKACPNLKHFGLEGIVFGAEFLAHLPTSIENLEFKPLFDFKHSELLENQPFHKITVRNIYPTADYLFQSLKNLKRFILTDMEYAFSPVSGPRLPRLVANFPNLEELNLHESSGFFHDQDFNSFSELADLPLRMLVLSSVLIDKSWALDDLIFTATENDTPLKNSLRSLIIKSTRLTGKAARALTGFTRLEEVSASWHKCEQGINGCNFWDLHFTLSHCHALTRFSIMKGKKNITPFMIEQLALNIGDTYCDVQHNIDNFRDSRIFANNSIRALAASCENLEYLSFSFCYLVSMKGVNELLLAQLLRPGLKRKKPLTLYCYTDWERKPGKYGPIDFTTVNHPSIAACPHTCRVGGVFHVERPSLKNPDAFPCFHRPQHFSFFSPKTPCVQMVEDMAREEKERKEADKK